MTAPVFGMQFSRPKDEPVPVVGADFSKLLIIETSEDASPSEYPLDTPVRIATSDADAIEALGTGLVSAAVRGIQDQLDTVNSGADVTVVRVAEGVDTAATAAAIAAIVDSLAEIPTAVNATPRLVLAGRTAWRPDLDTVNPVVASLEANLGKIMAIAPVDVDDTTKEAAIDARETMTSERVMPIGVAARVWEDGQQVTRPMGPYVAGLFVRVDKAHEGKPFQPIANRPIYGLAGLSRKVPFSLLDGATEGQQMLAANVSIVAEGAAGVDGAVAEGGFHFIGTDNAQTGELWEQIHQVRGTDFIITKIIQITREFLGGAITPDRAEAWINSIAFMLRDHKAAADILGYTPQHQMFRPDRNSPEDIRLGHLKLDLGIEPAPVFKLASHAIRRFRPALDDLVGDIIARLSRV